MDLQAEISVKLNELNNSIKQLRVTGSKYAESYAKYRIALAKELTKLKDEGMAVTLAYDIARGSTEIANYKFAEIRDEAIYKANQESINATKLEIKILEEQIKREWGQAKNE